MFLSEYSVLCRRYLVIDDPRGSKFAEVTLCGTHRQSRGGAIVREVGKVLHAPVVACQIDSAARESKAIDAGMEFLQGYRLLHKPYTLRGPLEKVREALHRERGHRDPGESGKTET